MTARSVLLWSLIGALVAVTVSVATDLWWSMTVMDRLNEDLARALSGGQQ